jgi:hypothetical protein
MHVLTGRQRHYAAAPALCISSSEDPDRVAWATPANKTVENLATSSVVFGDDPVKTSFVRVQGNVSRS